MPRLPLEYRLAHDAAPMRLDAALAPLFAELGVRARRRLWNWCRVRVNGCARHPGYTVGPGDLLRLEALGPEPERAPVFSGIRLLALSGDFAAFEKPAGLHSATVAGSPEASLEALIPALWGELLCQWSARAGQGSALPPDCPPRLLTRLDQATSGLVLAARQAEAERRFRRQEERGLVRKRYLALVRGRLEGPLKLTGKLLVDDRRMTGVSAWPDPDPARHTLARPLAHVGCEKHRPLPDGVTGPHSLVLVEIRRGARHQIRAHLAEAGFPLCGEWLYCPVAHAGERRLYLHHAALDMPGFTALSLPPWAGIVTEETSDALKS